MRIATVLDNVHCKFCVPNSADLHLCCIVNSMRLLFFPPSLPPSLLPSLPPFLPPSQHFHPDGHIAPVRDLLGRLSVGTQTPPHINTHSSPSSLSPYPTPTPSPSQPAQSPLQLPTQSPHSTLTPQPLLQSTSPRPSQSSQTDPDFHVGHSFAYYSTMESPVVTENLIILHPSFPKPSFAREPPDGAERCIIRQEARWVCTVGNWTPPHVFLEMFLETPIPCPVHPDILVKLNWLVLDILTCV